ncbi:MAG: hypothetical protein HY343_01060 [Lentisphaerae bacterium]|nr:hypothetical protein [Lentisphaerota bacterium]
MSDQEQEYRKFIGQFPLFAPGSDGPGKGLAEQTVIAINQTIPLMALFLDVVGRNRLTDIVQAVNFCADEPSKLSARQLMDLFKKYGSDKATFHNYHTVYGAILKNPEAIAAILEIGLGSNNEGVVSGMGAAGKPGASLRAFRDFLPRATVYGADVDKRVLFEEDRIKTFFVDQTDLNTFDELGKHVGGELDLVIDDGLHAPNANLAVLIFALKRLKVGGWLVIEDIMPACVPLWQVISALLPETYKPRFVAALRGNLFLVERLA